jgi:hypothetical protein
MQLTRACRPEPREQPSFRDRVLNLVDVSIEVEPEGAGANLPHGHDRPQVSFLATPNERHGGATTRRFRHAELDSVVGITAKPFGA